MFGTAIRYDMAVARMRPVAPVVDMELRRTKISASRVVFEAFRNIKSSDIWGRLKEVGLRGTKEIQKLEKIQDTKLLQTPMLMIVPVKDLPQWLSHNELVQKVMFELCIGFMIIQVIKWVLLGLHDVFSGCTNEKQAEEAYQKSFWPALYYPLSLQVWLVRLSNMNLTVDAIPRGWEMYMGIVLAFIADVYKETKKKLSGEGLKVSSESKATVAGFRMMNTMALLQGAGLEPKVALELSILFWWVLYHQSTRSVEAK